MEVKFTKRKKPTSRQRIELEEFPKAEIQINKPSVVIAEVEDEEIKEFQPKRKILPQAPPSASHPIGAYYQISYSQEYLENLKKDQKREKIELIPQLEVISESDRESNPPSSVYVAEDEEIDESDKEKAKEAREIRMQIRKQSEGDIMDNENNPETNIAENPGFYKILYMNVKDKKLTEEDDDEQIHDWEEEVMNRGIGKKIVEDRSITKAVSNKLTVKSQLSGLLRDIKIKCGILSVENVRYNMQKHMREMQSALDLNRKRLEEVNAGLAECRKKIEHGEINKKLSVERENYYSELLAYITDLEDLFSILLLYLLVDEKVPLIYDAEEKLKKIEKSYYKKRMKEIIFAANDALEGLGENILDKYKQKYEEYKTSTSERDLLEDKFKRSIRKIPV